QATTGSPQPHPALSLRDLKVERSFEADRLLVNGAIRCQWMHVGGALRAQGLRVHRRRIDGGETVDLSHTVVGGPLDFCAYVSKERRPGGHRRTRFDGHCKLAGLEAGMLNLSGAAINGGLDLDACRIKGTVNFEAVGLGPDHKTYLSLPGWRTVVNGYL